MENRVMVSARKFTELGAAVTDEIAEIRQIETTTRTLSLEFDDPEPPPANNSKAAAAD
jgi:hypothetical protein